MIETSYEVESARIGNAGPLVIASYQGVNTINTLYELENLQKRLLTSHVRLSSLTVLLGQPKTDDEMKKYSVELAERYEKSMHGAAIVILSKGLGAVMIRSFLSTYFILTRSTLPTQVFPNVASALTWLRELPGENPLKTVALSTQDIEQFVHQA